MGKPIIPHHVQAELPATKGLKGGDVSVQLADSDKEIISTNCNNTISHICAKVNNKAKSGQMYRYSYETTL